METPQRYGHETDLTLSASFCSEEMNTQGVHTRLNLNLMAWDFTQLSRTSISTRAVEYTNSFK